MINSSNMIDVIGLGKEYSKNPVIDDVSFTVQKGETVTIIGPSGSGKSTLLRCINFLEPFQRGQIFVNGYEVGYKTHNGHRRQQGEADIARQRARTAMVFQNFNLFSNKTVLENIVLGPMLVNHLPRAKAEERGHDLLATVALPEKAHAYPLNLSGGQQQRVGIARALAMDPDVVLFDEVTSALDPELVGEVLTVMRDLSKEDITLMIVTHEMQFAADVSDSMMFLDKGKIIKQGSPEAIFHNSDNERLTSFLSRFNART